MYDVYIIQIKFIDQNLSIVFLTDKSNIAASLVNSDKISFIL